MGLETMFGQLHVKLASLDGGKFHLLSQGLREEVERASKEEHHWEPYNVDQLVGVVPALSVCRSVCLFMAVYTEFSWWIWF